MGSTDPLEIKRLRAVILPFRHWTSFIFRGGVGQPKSSPGWLKSLFSGKRKFYKIKAIPRPPKPEDKTSFRSKDEEEQEIFFKQLPGKKLPADSYTDSPLLMTSYSCS